MTKKEERAARIEAAKRAAYLKKVQTLVGYVGPRVSLADAVAAIAAGKAPESYAFELASLEPVGKAVFAVKADAIKSAGDAANERVAKMTEKLEAAGWNLDVLAPRAASSDSRETYLRKSAIRQEYSSIVERTGDSFMHHREPYLCAISPERVAKYVADAEREAAFQYDEFVCKLVAKVGPVDRAALEGSHVWSSSILTVEKGAKVERWSTKQIWNVSVLGLVFPQWPTRLLKEG